MHKSNCATAVQAAAGGFERIPALLSRGAIDPQEAVAGTEAGADAGLCAWRTPGRNRSCP
eukprot:7525350-Alexandrium_andersonii.AAC.1